MSCSSRRGSAPHQSMPYSRGPAFRPPPCIAASPAKKSSLPPPWSGGNAPGSRCGIRPSSGQETRRPSYSPSSTQLDIFRSRPDASRWCAFLGSAAEYADPPAEISHAVTADTATLRDRLTFLAEPVVGDDAEALCGGIGTDRQWGPRDAAPSSRPSNDHRSRDRDCGGRAATASIADAGATLGGAEPPRQRSAAGR